MIFSKLHDRWLLFALGLLAAAVVAFIEWISADQATKAVNSLPLVRTAPARRTDVEVTKNVIGTVLASGQVNVQAQISGRLIAARFAEGQFVHRGDVLFEIDPRPAQAGLEQAESMLAKDEAALANAENDERRYKALFNANATSTQQRDLATTTAKSDRAVVGADRAAVDIARLNLEYTEIRSPVDGKTGAIQVQPGNIVLGGQGGNTLVTVTELRPVKISFFLPQSEMQLVFGQAKGDAVRIAYSALSTGQGEEIVDVGFVDSIVDSQSGTVEFRAIATNRNLALWPGETINVRVILRKLKNVVVVPREAVNSGSEGDYVYALDRASKAVRIPVTVLNDDGASDAVSGSIGANEQVVTEGQFRLAPGMQVSVLDRPVRAVSVDVAGAAQ